MMLRILADITRLARAGDAGGVHQDAASVIAQRAVASKIAIIH